MFRFRVLEYLKGSGSTEIVGVTDQTQRYETRAEAEAQDDDLLSLRDTSWDDREAIVFLWNYVEGSTMPHSVRQADRYWIGMRSYYGQDAYTIASQISRRWLPAASAQADEESSESTSGTDSQLFILGIGADAGTITLGDLKSKFASFEAEVAAGGGSEEYRKCLAAKYSWERRSAQSVARFGFVGAYNFS